MANLISNTTYFDGFYEFDSDLQIAVENQLTKSVTVASDLQAAEGWLNDWKDANDRCEMISRDEQAFTVRGKEDEKHGYTPSFRVVITAHYLDSASDDYIYTVRVSEL